MGRIVVSEWKKPPLAEALKRARSICSEPIEPPLTRQEIYSVYRQAKAPGGWVVIRCSFEESTSDFALEQYSLALSR